MLKVHKICHYISYFIRMDDRSVFVYGKMENQFTSHYKKYFRFFRLFWNMHNQASPQTETMW